MFMKIGCLKHNYGHHKRYVIQLEEKLTALTYLYILRIERFLTGERLVIVDLVLESLNYSFCLCQVVQPLFALFLEFGISWREVSRFRFLWFSGTYRSQKSNNCRRALQFKYDQHLKRILQCNL